MLIRLCAAIAFVLLVAGAAAEAGEPGLVRVLWFVDTGRVCAIRQPLKQSSKWQFPKQIEAEVCPPGMSSPGTTSSTDPADRMKPGAPATLVVSAGDFVQVFAVRYNAVRFKPLKGTVRAIDPEVPRGIQLLEVFTRFVAGPTLPPTASAQLKGYERGLPTTSTGGSCGEPEDPTACVKEARIAFQRVRTVLDEWTSESAPSRLTHSVRRHRVELLEAVAALNPNSPDLSSMGNLSNRLERVIGEQQAFAAWYSCTTDKRTVLGTGCGFPADGYLERIESAVGTLAGLISQFKTSCDTVGCGESPQAKEIAQIEKAFASALKATLGPAKPDALVRPAVGEEIADVSRAFAALTEMAGALSPAGHAKSAVEFEVTGPISPLATLVIDLPLENRVDTLKTVESLVLRAAPSSPWVVAGVGVVFVPNAFNFAKLGFSQQPATDATGPKVAKTIVAVPESQIRWATGLLATNVRIVPRWRLYAMVGTTIDKDIFKTAVLGGAWRVPQWRSMFFLGAMGASGTTEDELASVIEKYSSGGVALADLDLTLVPAPSSWHWRVVGGWSFGVF